LWGLPSTAVVLLLKLGENEVCFGKKKVAEQLLVRPLFRSGLQDCLSVWKDTRFAGEQMKRTSLFYNPSKLKVKN
jgi:hypothetical protein